MTMSTARSLACSLALLGVLGPVRTLHAQLGIGTWVREVTPTTTAMTMKVEPCCGEGHRLTYHFDINGTEMILALSSRFDGSEADVLMNGKPSGETMAITQVDDRHFETIVKLNGQPFGTSKATLSADGKVLTVVNDFSSSVGGNPAGKSTETWVRQ